MIALAWLVISLVWAVIIVLTETPALPLVLWLPITYAIVTRLQRRHR